MLTREQAEKELEKKIEWDIDKKLVSRIGAINRKDFVTLTHSLNGRDHICKRVFLKYNDFEFRISRMKSDIADRIEVRFK